MPPAGTDALNLYIVESRFQALVAVLIARSQPGRAHVVAYIIPAIGSFLARFPFIQPLDLGGKVRFGPWKRPRTLRRRLQRLVAALRCTPGLAHIHLYVANLKTPLLNYPIRYLPAHLPGTRLHVHILTDGTSNFRRLPMTDKARARLQRQASRWPWPWLGLHFQPFGGDRLGIESELVETITLLPGAPHQYDPARVQPLPMPDLGLPRAPAIPGERRALVIGEKLTDRGYLTPADERAIAARIGELLAAAGITRVDYVPHPTARHPDLQLPHYTPVQTDDPVELRILAQPYELVVGVVTTALFTARLLAGDGCRTLSVGANRCVGRNDLAEGIRQAFAGMGVEVIDLPPPPPGP